MKMHIFVYQTIITHTQVIINMKFGLRKGEQRSLPDIEIKIRSSKCMIITKRIRGKKHQNVKSIYKENTIN